MSSLAQRAATPNDTFEFEGGFDPNPKTNPALRDAVKPAPSRREREFRAWQAEGPSVTRRALLSAAPEALIAAAEGFRGVPPLTGIRRPLPPPPPPAVPARADEITLRRNSITATACAPIGSRSAARLERLFQTGRFSLQGGRFESLAKITSDRGVLLCLRPVG